MSAECAMTNPQIAFELNSTGMTGTVLIEIVGLKNSECCPFPCDERPLLRTFRMFSFGKSHCGIRRTKKSSGSQGIWQIVLRLKLTLIDTETPDHIRKIIED